MKKKFAILISVNFLLWFTIFLVQASANSTAPHLANKSSIHSDNLLQAPASPLTATLAMPVVPGVNQPALLIINVGTVVDAPNMTATLSLPDGAEVIEGETSWEVSLNTGQTATFTTTIQFGQTGEQEIYVYLQQPIDANNTHLGEGALVVTIGEQAGETGFTETQETPGQVEALSSGSTEETSSSDEEPSSTTDTSTPAAPNTALPCLNAGLIGIAAISIFHRRKINSDKEEPIH
jgi:hypothetical protein